MPWSEICTMELRESFIKDWLKDEEVVSLCCRYGISRKTAYKHIARFKEEGLSGLADRPRRPRHSPQATSPEIVDQLIELRRSHPTWGPKKLVVKLSQLRPDLDMPAVSTAGGIIKRAGLIDPRHRRRRRPEIGRAWPRGDHPNAIWCTDYKGQFRLGNGSWCYPLTISDEYSRFLFPCRGYDRIDGEQAQAHFRKVFRRFGMPEAIRSDNGSPFASTGLGRLSRLSVWWFRLGIALKRNQPAHPEQNGRHERIHRDMKAETTRPPAHDLSKQQQRIDSFVREHNDDRPHEALGQQVPARHYRPSARPFPERIPRPEYPSHYEVRRVGSNGCIKFWGDWLFLSHALIEQEIGMIEVDDGIWAMYLGGLQIARLDRRTNQFDEPDDAEEVQAS